MVVFVLTKQSILGDDEDALMAGGNYTRLIKEHIQSLILDNTQRF
jgi:hypothetical protein